MSFILLFFLILQSSAASPLSNEQTLTNLARSLFSEDLFLAHLKSDLVNKSINPCDNFYRRVCPKDMPKDSWLWRKFIKQIDSILNVKDLLQPQTERLNIERMRATELNDKTDYDSIPALIHALNKVSVLLIYLSYTT
ncbi:hypothetical protein PFISCL1PPCAC_25828, partial [Pristionchus fissidentatus]